MEKDSAAVVEKARMQVNLAFTLSLQPL